MRSEYWEHFLNTQLPLDEDENILMKNWMMSNTREQSRSYVILVRKNSFFNSIDVSMLGYGFGVSKYHQFYYQYLDKYQVLPHASLVSFEGDYGENLIK